MFCDAVDFAEAVIYRHSFGLNRNCPFAAFSSNNWVVYCADIHLSLPNVCLNVFPAPKSVGA
jgi:hypothetical protein